MSDTASRRVPTPLPAAAPSSLRVLTINTHKGFSALNRRFVLGELREAVRATAADLVFLQEVVGEPSRRRASGSQAPHYEYLADSLWTEHAYGRNAVHPRGHHHGNAVLSRLPIAQWRNHDVTQRGVEPRGLLHCRLDWPGKGSLHAICVHLGLREWQRMKQLAELVQLVEREIPADDPLIVAGDFNDWRRRADATLRDGCGMQSAFAARGQDAPATFPARWPLLALDRIYVRGLEVRSAAALAARPWPHLSDHLPLLAEVQA